VYVNNKLIGAFELPSTIPVLTSGKQRITILAGIKKNGLSYERLAYPFYEAYNIEREFVPSVVDTLMPVVGYRSGLKFPWLEDFEDGSVSMEGSGANTTHDSLYITGLADDVYDYNGTTNKFSGKVTMPAGLQFFENSTIELFDLPRGGQEIYLELNFKCNTEFALGMYPINAQVVTGFPVVNLFSTVDSDGKMQWKKVYISLKEDVNSGRNLGAEFTLFFNSQTNTSSGTPTLLFDNIKLIHF